MSKKVGLPKGLRDFLPQEVRRREWMYGVMREYFERWGYVPIETPVMEALSTLTGKYGEEGDKLLFRVLNNGDFLAKADEKALAERDSKALVPSISKRGLRYDLTVPFARYVVMHRHELALPFKRYQIQPVWRADRPQRGRYQEFYQCDADVVGSDSLLYEAELLGLMDRVFTELKIPVTIRINHRGILSGLAQAVLPDSPSSTLIGWIDKLDKLDEDRVLDEIRSLGASDAGIETLQRYLRTDLDGLAQILNDAETQRGLSELNELLDMLSHTTCHNTILWDPTLARGLDYYTGMVVEVITEGESLSIGGGGRYADLTSVFGMNNLSGVGISFGAERIYNIIEENNLWPEELLNNNSVLICPMDDESMSGAILLADRLRNKLTRPITIYPQAAKLSKQLKYADQINADKAIIIGSEEINNQRYTLKDMTSGEQSSNTLSELCDKLLV